MANANGNATGRADSTKPAPLTDAQKAIAVAQSEGMVGAWHDFNKASGTAWARLCAIALVCVDKQTWNATVKEARTKLEAAKEESWSGSTFGQYVSNLGQGIDVGVLPVDANESRAAFNARREAAGKEAGKLDRRGGRKVDETGEALTAAESTAAGNNPALPVIAGQDGKPIIAVVDTYATEGTARGAYMDRLGHATRGVSDDVLGDIVRIAEIFGMIAPEDREAIVTLAEDMESKAVDAEAPAADADDAKAPEAQADQPQPQRAVNG